MEGAVGLALGGVWLTACSGQPKCWCLLLLVLLPACCAVFRRVSGCVTECGVCCGCCCWLSAGRGDAGVHKVDAALLQKGRAHAGGGVPLHVERVLCHWPGTQAAQLARAMCVTFLSPQRAAGDLGVVFVRTGSQGNAACLGHGQHSTGSGEVGRALDPAPPWAPELASHLRSHTHTHRFCCCCSLVAHGLHAGGPLCDRALHVQCTHQQLTRVQKHTLLVQNQVTAVALVLAKQLRSRT